ncbi:endosialidase catalytic beta-propeller domain-containing protein, partial [Mannheimia haemolytica]|nr:endosialidase catalytic beta-propeller domain-containing protein [Mannheimia haemolytica]
MRQTMNPITTDNGRFKDGNPATGEYGTVVTAEHMNNVQDSVISMQNEIITVLNEAGIAVNPNDNTQLWQALQMIAGQVESIADLRQFEPVKDRQVVFVKAYHTGSDKGGGYFVSDFADTVSADNSVTLFVTANGKRWKRLYSTLNIFDFGVRLDSVNNDAINRLQAWQEPVLGLGNVIPASSRIVPASHISQVAYRFNGIDYLSEDYYKADLSQITRTGYYTAWTQDKAFVHNGVIYAPFMLAFRHGYDDLRIAWVKSFDNGNTWTTPEILMDYHPQNPTLGWHCFSMGIVGNRLFMLVEERDVASKKMVRSFLYSRVMTKNFFVTGGISQSGNVVTVELEEHGLFVGDSISFSNSGISGVSGKMTVTSVLDANR